MTMMGANPKADRTEFRVWAPSAKRAKVRLIGRDGGHRDLRMGKSGDTFELVAEALPGDRYFYLLDNDPLQFPDPVSRLLPEDVHGPTEIVDPAAFAWTDSNWRGVEYREYVLYELHVGTFTPKGTFDGVIDKLDHLKELGVTVIELMPVGAFPGKRNWGYDGVSMYAVQASYGGPEGLKRLVEAAHAKGLAVVLDVIYNHLGAEGNYLSKFGPYFTSKHKTPWGDAFNYDDKHSEGTRNYVRENAVYWICEYHLDGLRMDAVHSIQDESKTHILVEIRDAVQKFAAQARRRVCLMVESHENSPRYVKPRSQGGFGMDGIWSDDFHHALHAVATGESEGYYQDFGGVEKLVKALNEGFVFQGEEFKFWGKPRGESSRGMPLEAHVVCMQNHDQVGNRALGERLTKLVSLGMRKIMAAIVLLAPETPLLFMGQESDEPAPFQFFTDFGDPNLQIAVSEGRRKEFKGFSGFGNEFPDPQNSATFERSRLSWDLTPERREMLEWYRQLLRLRGTLNSSERKRNCSARVLGESGMEMQVPASKPQLVLRADWTGEKISSAPGGWSQALRVEDGEYRLEIWVSPEIQNQLRHSMRSLTTADNLD
jgi:maltooligosyltrehalose trehalohydrolase